jgi:hypothetical protein
LLTHKFELMLPPDMQASTLRDPHTPRISYIESWPSASSAVAALPLYGFQLLSDLPTDQLVADVGRAARLACSRSATESTRVCTRGERSI